MHDSPMDEVTEDFARCWNAAGRHLEQRIPDESSAWLRAHLAPPYLEHLSFRIGNRLIFVRIEDADGAIEVPGSRAGLLEVAVGCGGIACLLPMRNTGGAWTPVEPGWGLIEATTLQPVDPTQLVDDALIEMTDWELQDFAVQVVRRTLEKQGRELMSWQGNPELHPAIWFVGDAGPEWVVVRVVRYPQREAAMPEEMEAIAARCSATGRRGHFASVAVANAREAEGGAPDGNPLPLWRGQPLMVAFRGLSEYRGSQGAPPLGH
jgi:hypothetical protein